ncbi:M15 family metallopeptidase [Vibrio vulnificus]
MNRKAVNKVISQFALSARSEARMMGVHNDLKRVVRRAIELTPFDFGITAGNRTAEEQNVLYKQGSSTLDGYNKISRHQTGHAIDFVAYDENGKVTWSMAYYEAISGAFKQAASELGYPIIWGGDWSSFVDGPHIELDRKYYA